MLMAVVAALVASNSEEIVEMRYLASAVHTANLYSYDEQSEQLFVADTLVRGAELSVVVNGKKKINDVEYLPVKMGKELRYATIESLVADPRAVVQEKSVFVRTPASIIVDQATSLVGGLADKGEEVEVIGYDSLDVNGRVYKYKVRQGSVEGYLFAKYTVFDKEQAL